MVYLEYLLRHPRRRLGRSSTPPPAIAGRTRGPASAPTADGTRPSATAFVSWVVLGAIAAVLAAALLAGTPDLLTALLGGLAFVRYHEYPHDTRTAHHVTAGIRHDAIRPARA